MSNAEFDRRMKEAAGMWSRSDRAVCVALPYKNPAYVAEASRRGLTAEKCRAVMRPPPE